MKATCLVLAILCPAIMPAQSVAAADSEPLTISGKLYYHYEKVFSPFALLQDGVQAAILQRNDNPHEWHEGWYGLWRRAASTTGYDAVRNSFMFTLNSLSRQDPRYARMGEGESAERAGHAIGQTFAGHTDGGKKALPWVRFAATYGAAFLANAWNPDRLSDTRHAMLRGTVTLATDASNNLFDEFWPDIKKKLFRRKTQPGVLVKTP
jgi:hypothetical protein